MRANEHIRKMIRGNKIYQWQVAETLGVSEVTLIRWLRTPLGREKEKVVVQAIEDTKNSRKEGR